MVNLDEKRDFIKVIFQVLARQNDDTLMNMFGSYTARQVRELGTKFDYEDYCDRHNIEFEDMTEDDFVAAYEDEQLEAEKEDYDIDPYNDYYDFQEYFDEQGE